MEPEGRTPEDGYGGSLLRFFWVGSGFRFRVIVGYVEFRVFRAWGGFGGLRCVFCKVFWSFDDAEVRLNTSLL